MAHKADENFVGRMREYFRIDKNSFSTTPDSYSPRGAAPGGQQEQSDAGVFCATAHAVKALENLFSVTFRYLSARTHKSYATRSPSTGVVVSLNRKWSQGASPRSCLTPK